MESSIAVFLMRQSACELLPTIIRRTMQSVPTMLPSHVNGRMRFKFGSASQTVRAGNTWA